MTNIHLPDQLGLTRPTAGAFHFVLEPNEYQSYLQDFARLVTIVILPVLTMYCLLLVLADMEPGERTLLTLGGLVVVSVAFWLDRSKRRARPKPCSLVIHGKKVILKGEKCSPSTMELNDLQVEWLGWGNDLERLLPAVRITGPDGQIFSIGLAEGNTMAIPARNTVQATDFLLSSEPAWKELKKALQANNK